MVVEQCGDVADKVESVQVQVEAKSDGHVCAFEFGFEFVFRFRLAFVFEVRSEDEFLFRGVVFFDGFCSSTGLPVSSSSRC